MEFIMNSNGSVKSLVFIDERVVGYKSLLDKLPDGSIGIVLAADYNGVDKICEVLHDYNDLDSIHLVSHGGPGKLYLGGMVLDGESVDDYKNQLEGIGSALTGGGDLLIYGCDVAQGSVGQNFVEKLTGITGADVAASTNWSGGAMYGGDDVFEFQSGLIGAEFLPAVKDLNGTLDATSGQLLFSWDDASIDGDGSWSLIKDKMLIGFKKSYLLDTKSFSVGEEGDEILTGSVDMNIKNVQFGVKCDVGMSGGVFDLSCPVNYSYDAPTSVKPGTYYQIAAGAYSITNPEFSLDGPSLSASMSLGYELDVEASGEMTVKTPSWLPNISGSLSSGFKTTGLVSLDYSKWPAKSEFGDFVDVGLNIDMNAFDGSTTFLGTSKTPKLEIKAMQADPFFYTSVDIDDLIGLVFPALKTADVKTNKPDIEMGLFSADLIMAVNPYIKANVNIKDVLLTVTVTDENGESQSQQKNIMTAPQYFDFFASNNTSGSLDVRYDYSLVGSVDFEWGLQLDAGFLVKLVEFQSEAVDWSLLKLEEKYGFSMSMGVERLIYQV
jgi:Domain of unknown function (DUF4347)